MQEVPSAPSKHLLYARTGVLVLLCWAMTSCQVVTRTAELPEDAVRVVAPGSPKKKPLDPIEMQQGLLRFGDELSGQLVASVDKLQRNGVPLDRITAVQMKLAFTSELWQIASGPSIYANMIDMMVVVKLLRLTVEERWVDGKFGESALHLAEICRRSEDKLWEMSSVLLQDSQKDELTNAVIAIHHSAPDFAAILRTRAIGILDQPDQSNETRENRPSSVFSLLMLDPLSGLDPATREIAQTRLLAERALFVSQRMPDILRWQAELLSYQSLDTPEMQSLLETTEVVGQAAQRISQTVTELPQTIRSEREAIIAALAEQESGLTELVSETKEALIAGERAITASESALKTFDQINEKMTEKAEKAPPPDPDAKPFEIQDLTESAAQLEKTSVSLQALLDRFDQTLGSDNITKFQTDLEELAAQTRKESEQLVSFIFWRLLLLLVAAAGLFLVSVGVYRRWFR
jgi:hypothetical protein